VNPKAMNRRFQEVRKFIALILSSSLSHAQLGKIFNVSASAIQHVKEGKTWKSVKR